MCGGGGGGGGGLGCVQRLLILLHVSLDCVVMAVCMWEGGEGVHVALATWNQYVIQVV